MELAGRSVALYGRFSPGARDRLQQRIAEAGGEVARDLTRHSDVLVVGALATALIDGGALAPRLKAAAERALPVFSEPAFAAALDCSDETPAPTLPLATLLAQTSLPSVDAVILAAFDLIEIADGCCRFADAAVIRAAADLLGQGRTLGQTVRILIEARELSPKGRHRIVVTSGGEATLEWEDGRRTSLGGQGYLPLDEDHPSLDDLFEAAALAEAGGDADVAARLYDQCARSDRADPIAPYNLANLRLADADYDGAALAYRQALARDARFSEARYNLAQALEAAGKPADAAAELGRLVALEPGHADAVFNLAQLTLQDGDAAAAKALFQRYLALGPPPDWADTARKAILVCEAELLALRHQNTPSSRPDPSEPGKEPEPPGAAGDGPNVPVHRSK